MLPGTPRGDIGGSWSPVSRSPSLIEAKFAGQRPFASAGQRPYLTTRTGIGVWVITSWV